MGVVISTLKVPVRISSLMEELSIIIAISWTAINWYQRKEIITARLTCEYLETWYNNEPEPLILMVENHIDKINIINAKQKPERRM